MSNVRPDPGLLVTPGSLRLAARDTSGCMREGREALKIGKTQDLVPMRFIDTKQSLSDVYASPQGASLASPNSRCRKWHLATRRQCS